MASGASGGQPDTGGSGSAGHAGSATTEPMFILGADISSVQEASDRGATYVDTDGIDKGLIELLGNHGFNYVRLRAFVDPDALYGYANPTGDAQFRKDESYCDTEHTLAQALQAKRAGMGFLLDLHYSDNWADPGKQIIPAAWRGVSSLTNLAAQVKEYTAAVVSAMVDGGARPDMVQIGNEITPGLLIHVPAANPNPDQWGNIDKVTNDVNGSAANFANVATLLQAGVDGVRSVDPTIKIMLHVENTKSFPAVRSWVEQIRQHGVEFDVLGLSCYTAYQGLPTVWQDTFTQLAAAFPDISFAIAEYNPELARANQIMRDLPDGRGLGTFFWEPTQSGAWGASLFSFAGDAYTANVDDFAEIDALRPSLGL
jgi:arabinogalactan endo-1,4-beta-galactosidase